MIYRLRKFSWFTITDFNNTVSISHAGLPEANSVLRKLSHKVHVKIDDLRRKHPGMKDLYKYKKKSRNVLFLS